MRIIRLYFLAILLALVSMVLLVKGAMFFKESIALSNQEAQCTRLQSQISSETQQGTIGGKIMPQELMTLKKLIEGLALQNSIDITVEVMDGQIKILGGLPPTETGKPTNDKEILLKYSQVLSFISAFSSLPYNMEYKTFCLGEQCARSFDVVVSITK